MRKPYRGGIRFKPSQELIAALNGDASFSVNRNRSHNTTATIHNNLKLKEAMEAMSKDYQRAAARDRNAHKKVTDQRQKELEHEAYRKSLQEKIRKWGPDFSKWPENKPFEETP